MLVGRPLPPAVVVVVVSVLLCLVSPALLLVTTAPGNADMGEGHRVFKSVTTTSGGQPGLEADGMAVGDGSSDYAPIDFSSGSDREDGPRHPLLMSSYWAPPRPKTPSLFPRDADGSELRPEFGRPRRSLRREVVRVGDGGCPPPGVCVGYLYAPLLCRTGGTVSSSAGGGGGGCGHRERCCELTGGNHGFRSAALPSGGGGSRRRQADGCPADDDKYFCSPNDQTDLCQTTLGERDCGSDHVCCEIIPITKQTVVPAAAIQLPSTPKMKCPLESGNHFCVAQEFEWSCDDNFEAENCPEGQVCCQASIEVSLTDPSRPAGAGVAGAAPGADGGPCAPPRTCVEKLSAELVCDASRPVAASGCPANQVCCSLLPEIPELGGGDDGKQQHGGKAVSEVDAEVRRCLESSGAPSGAFQRLVDEISSGGDGGRRLVGLSGDPNHAGPAPKKCFRVGGECMPGDEEGQCTALSKGGETFVFDREYFCLPPNSVCCRRLKGAETPESVAVRASFIPKSSFACTDGARFTGNGIFIPKCWLVEIFLEEESRRIGIGALIQLDVVSTSAAAFTLLDTVQDKFYVRVGDKKKYYTVKSVTKTDSEGEGRLDPKRDLVFLYLDQPANVDEAQACTICFANFDYNPDCFATGADMECQVFDSVPGGWRAFPIKGLAGSGSRAGRLVVPEDDCASSLDFALGPHQWCLTRSMTDFCPSRTGAPLVCTIKDGEPRLFGHWSQPTRNCARKSSVITLVTNRHTRSVLQKTGKANTAAPEGDCGVLPPGVETRVLGGRDTSTDLWPWLVTILYSSPRLPQARVICGGSLIAPSWVLTAAHCFEFSTDPERYRLASGNSESVPRDPTIDSLVQTRIASKVEIHPNYDPRNYYTNDIALVGSKKPFELGPEKERTALICLPLDIKAGDEPFQDKGQVAGWGDTASNKQSTKLQEAEMIVLKDSECRAALARRPGFNADGIFCAKSNPLEEAFQTVCKGDSGSPFVTRDNQKYTLQGLVSLQLNEKQCSRQPSLQTPVIFTKVSAYLPWIRERMSFLSNSLRK